MKKKNKAPKETEKPQWIKITAGMIVRVPDFKKCEGLVPVVVQENGTERVLMLAYTRKKEFSESFHSGEAVFWSRSRRKRWKKGEEKSGNILFVSRILIDCDGDALLYVVRQTKPESGACHTGKQTCFFRAAVGSALEDDGFTALELALVIARLG